MIALAILTDGRAELLEQTLESARDNLKGPITHRIMVNDSGDQDYAAHLRRLAPEFTHVTHGQRQGLAAAVQSVWEAALATDADYLFHLEGDWTFNEPVDLEDLVDLLARKPYLAEVVLQRQALAPSEIEAGGVAAHPDWIQRQDVLAAWVEEESIFSLNPCLIPRHILEIGWPSGPLGIGNESGFTSACIGRGYRFAFWGHKHDVPIVSHNGTYRAPGWAL